VSDTGAGRLLGLRRRGDPVVIYQLSRGDARSLGHGIALVAEIFFAAGAERVHTGVAGVPELRHPRDAAALRSDAPKASALPLTGFHPMGTVRMGEDGQRAPVDSWGAVRGVRGLHVADASLFPTCLGVNPQVSIMAFATRIARHLAAGA
jgi:choline dehydrogenase-like flavoprotein